MRQLPTATGEGLTYAELRDRLTGRPREKWIAKTVQVVAALVLVGGASYLIDDSGVRLVGIIVGVSAATVLLTRVFSP